jgi:carbon storage regulator
MLILLRKVGEEIVIGGRVLVTVIKVRSKSISLGITAPENVSVDRGEIHMQKKAESASAGQDVTGRAPAEKFAIASENSRNRAERGHRTTA